MYLDFALLIIRLVVGLIMAGHGAQKLFGWYGGPGMAGIQGWLGSIGLRPAGFWAFMAGLTEFGGGLLVAVGLLSPFGELAVIAAMIMAIALGHWGKGLWSTNGGSELPLINLLVCLALGLIGPGAFSLDAMFGLSFPQPWTLLIGLIAVIVGVAVALTTRSRPQTANA